MKKIIVISAHPDDEILGAGGTLIRHREKGDEIYWLIATGLSGENGFTQERIDSRLQEIETIARRLSIKKTYSLNFPTMSLTSGSLQKLIPQVSAIFGEIEPETIYCLNRSDAHSDHRVLFDAVMACTKSFRYPFVREVLMYECISETEFAPALPEKVFLPNYFVDISEYIDEKLELMAVYESELGDHPFPRSLENIRALAHFRGASVGVKYAEAFQLLKYIVK